MLNSEREKRYSSHSGELGFFCREDYPFSPIYLFNYFSKSGDIYFVLNWSQSSPSVLHLHSLGFWLYKVTGAPFAFPLHPRDQPSLRNPQFLSLENEKNIRHQKPSTPGPLLHCQITELENVHTLTCV
jgi:hypothetical protein